MATGAGQHRRAHLLPPEVIHYDPSNPARCFTFVDGGLTPYNNLSFLLYRVATQAAYQLGWAAGERTCCWCGGHRLRRA